jgi:predicted dienelactone hydrolase
MMSLTKATTIMTALFLSSLFIGCVGESDIDSDNITDSKDNCVDVFNPDQLDYDGDKIGDLCDSDDDNDDFPDDIDSHPLNSEEYNDLDNDGIGDNSDNDIDGDGVDNSQDHYPYDPNEKWDTDSDGIPNGVDSDDDGDGWNDSVDQFDLSPVTSLMEDGPFNSGTMDLVFTSSRGHDITIQVWYPTKEESGEKVIYNNVLPGFALDDSSPDCSETRPVTVYSHGFPSIRWGSAFLMEHLATHGYISIAPDHKFGTLLDANPNKLGEILLNMPVDMKESFDWLVNQNQANNEFNGCINPDDGYVAIGQSTGGYASMMVSGAEIYVSDLISGCDIGNPIHCNAIDYISENNLDSEKINFSDNRVRATILLSPWNGSVLDSGISNVGVPTLVLTGLVDDTTVISEVTNTSMSLGDSLINFGIFNNSGHYAFAPIGCAARGCDGLLDISESTDLANQSSIIFLAQLFSWPESESYQFPDSEYISWKYD